MVESSPPTDPAAGDVEGAAVGGPPQRGATSIRRVLFTVVPLVLLAALVVVGAALDWHQPLLTAFSPKLAPARGRVTYAGQAVSQGYVGTLPESSLAEPAIGVLGPDGAFELATNGKPGASIGSHTLMVYSNTTGFPPRPLIPPRYASPETPHRITVTSDAETNVFEIHLEADPNFTPASDEGGGGREQEASPRETE